MQLYSAIDGTCVHSHMDVSDYIKFKIHSSSTGHTTWRINDTTEALLAYAFLRNGQKLET